MGPRLRKLFGRSHFERDMAEEMEFHIERRAADLTRSGLSAAEAERRARLEFGSKEKAKEHCREAEGFQLLDELRGNLLYGFRSLRRSPAFTAAAILSLAIGIGANTAIFSLIDGLWFRPMPVPRASDVIHLFSLARNGSGDNFSWPEYQELTRQSSTLRGVVACGRRGAAIPRPDGTIESLLAEVVSANFFSVLGVKPVLGRTFTPEDDSDASGDAPVILGHSFWTRRFGADPNIIGKSIRFERNQPVFLTVVGVLPKEFRDTEPDGDRDVWLVPRSWIRLDSRSDFESREFRWLEVLALPAPGESVKSVRAEVAGIAARLASAWPETNTGRGAAAVSDLEYRLEAAGTEALVLLSVVLLVVVLCSVNVANLLLARGASRLRELSIRLALGAGRSRIARQLMTENAIIGAGGLAMGVLCGAAIIRAIPLLIIAPPGYRSFLSFNLDWRVFLFSVGVSLVTMILFGLAPALQGSRASLASAMKPGAPVPGSHTRGWNLRHWLVVCQIGLSLGLVSVSGVLVRSFVNTRVQDLGLARRQQLLLWVTAPERFYREVPDALRALPGVVEVAYASRAPLSLSEGGMAQRVSFPGRPELMNQRPEEIHYNAVSSNFFRQMGIAILRGRAFDEADQTTGPLSVVISEAMARRYWPGGDAIGRVIRVGGPEGRDRRIIGIARDTPAFFIGELPKPYLYLPYWHARTSSFTFIVETSGPAALLAPAARKTLLGVDRRLDPISMVTMQDLIRYSTRRYQIAAELVTALGLIGLVLTAVGLYGVIAHGVAERTREIGIRMALGASRAATLRLILGQTLRIGLVGLALGLPLALFGTRLTSKLLFGISPWDMPTLASGVLVLIAALLAAGSIPARRAASIEPMSALRYD
jgi:predicted permease